MYQRLRMSQYSAKPENYLKIAKIFTIVVNEFNNHVTHKTRVDTHLQ